MNTATALENKTQLRPPCILCGGPSSILGVCTHDYRPGHLFLYGLCDRHKVAQATVDQVDDLITLRLAAGRN